MKKFIPLILCNFAFAIEVLSVTDILIDHTIKLTDEEVEQTIQIPDGTEHIDPSKYRTLQKRFEERATTSSGGNQAATLKVLSHLGCSCHITGTMGKDIWGQRYLDLLDEHGVKVTPIYTSKMTGQCFCFLDPRGNRSMMTCLSAALALNEKNLEEETFKRCDLYYASAYSIFNEACFVKTLRLAKKHGAKIAIDLGSYNLVERFSDKLLALIDEYVDLVFANEEEGRALTQSEHLPDIVRSLAKHCSVVVVHSGASGGIVGANQKLYRYHSIPVKNVVDTTCAGDVFAAGFLYGYMHHLPITESTLYGAALGAAIVQVSGSDLPQKIVSNLPKYVEQQRKHFKFSIVN